MEYAAVFLTGAAGYSLLEVIWRGYTHWTMSVTGGICLLLIYFMNRSLDAGIWSKCLLGAALVLILISRNPKWIALNVPASLGKTFHPRN